MLPMSLLDATVKAISKNVTGVQSDACKLADLDRLFATIKQVQGHLDVLFANAGEWSDKPNEVIVNRNFARKYTCGKGFKGFKT